MIHAISSPTFDLDGFVEIDALPDQRDGDVARRVNRVKTLDGGVAINDFGFSEGDRTIDLAWSPDNLARETAVARLVQLYATLTVATRSGVYLAAPETYAPRADESRLRLLVIEKLSA